MFFVQEFRKNDYSKNEKISKNYAVYKSKTVVSVLKKLRWKETTMLTKATYMFDLSNMILC
jgi:hypothetical protein